MKNMRRLFLTVGIILFASFAAYGYEGNAAKKLIHFGWSRPLTPDEIFKTDINEFNAHCPFDGIGLYPVITIKREDQTIEYNMSKAAGDPQMITKEELQEWIPALKYLRENTHLKHNFILLNCAVFNGNWFDDEVWQRTMNNCSLMAWLAKESGFEGICLDLEGYIVTKRPFMFREELGHSFEETAAQVRKRGKEWIEEMNRQFPNLTLFTFVWASYWCNTPQRAAHPETRYGGRDGLHIAFFNGVYDGAPETMKIIDGQESPGYFATTDMEFDRITANYYRFGDAWIAPENRGKYRKITSMGLSFYLDRFKKSDKVTRYDRPHPHFPNLTTLLAHNVMNTLSYVDEYAWVWCARGTFWPNAEFNKYKPGVRKPFKFWNEVIPGCVEAIRFGKDWAKGIPSLAGKNVLRNGSLEPGESGITPGVEQEKSGIIGWSSWQDSKSPKGTITPENGMVRFVNVTNGCLAQAPVKKPEAGKKYIFTVRCKNESKVSRPRMGYSFRDAKTGWVYIGPNEEEQDFREKDADGWTRGTMLITVPDRHDMDISALEVTFGTTGKQDPSGEDKGILFDDAALYEVEYPWEKEPDSPEDK
ncbi:MAG: hypothetical protein J5944_03480 [Lentisphaeria bacterium]|nr:hypothetical protein [Lentisphaeria bacterium]